MAKGHRSQIKKTRNIETKDKRPHASAKFAFPPQRPKLSWIR